jgi:hypothetical protein
LLLSGLRSKTASASGVGTHTLSHSAIRFVGFGEKSLAAMDRSIARTRSFDAIQ